MKIREDFVTNSSSSSFVIVLQNNDSKNTVKTEKELIALFTERYDADFLEEPYCKRLFDKYVDLIRSGKQLYFGSISNDDYNLDLQNTVKDLGFNLMWESA